MLHEQLTSPQSESSLVSSVLMESEIAHESQTQSCLPVTWGLSVVAEAERNTATYLQLSQTFLYLLPLKPHDNIGLQYLINSGRHMSPYTVNCYKFHRLFSSERTENLLRFYEIIITIGWHVLWDRLHYIFITETPRCWQMLSVKTYWWMKAGGWWCVVSGGATLPVTHWTSPRPPSC